MGFYVKVNGVDTASLKVNHLSKTLVEAGEVNVHVTIGGPNPPAYCQFTAEAGQTYYYHFKSGMTAMKLVPYTDKEMSKGVHEKAIKKCKDATHTNSPDA